MKSIFRLFVGAALVGAGLGVALAYVEHGSPSLDLPQSRGPVNSAASKASSPRAQVPESTFEFGRMEQGTSMAHTFAIRNTGSASLDIGFLSNTCKCTAIKLNGESIVRGEGVSIAPGKLAEVDLEWAAKTSAGPFRHGATFSTNDPLLSRIELMVEGEVVESSTVQPNELLFGSVDTGKEQAAEVFVMSFVDRPVEILSHELNDDALAKQMKIKIAEVPKDQLPILDAMHGVKISAVYRAGETIGPFGGWLHLTTNLPTAERLMIPIAGRVTGDISIFGPHWQASSGLLRLGPVRSADGKQVRLNVAVRGKHAKHVELRVGRVDPSELKVELGEPKRLSDTLLHVPMIVAVPVGARPLVRMDGATSTAGSIVLESNHPEISEVVLRVRVAVTK